MSEQYPEGPVRGTDPFPQASTGPDDPPPSMFDDLAWTCHICSDERPDRLISVYTQPVRMDERLSGAGMVVRNIRYCNDRPSCVQGATTMEPLDLRTRGN